MRQTVFDVQMQDQNIAPLIHALQSLIENSEGLLDYRVDIALQRAVGLCRFEY